MRFSLKALGGRRKALFLLAELGFFILLVSATAASLRPLQRDLLSRMETARGEFIALAEEALERRIVYESLGPSVFRAMDLKNVRIMDGDRIVVSAERLRIEYSILDLVSGKGSDAVRELRLDKPTIDFDARRDSNLLHVFDKKSDPKKIEKKKSSGKKRKSEDNPFPEIKITLIDGNFGYTDDSLRMTLAGCSLSIEPEDDRLYVSARARGSASGGPIPKELGTVSLSFALRGDTRYADGKSSYTISLPRFETDEVVLAKQTVAAVYGDGVWEVRKIRDRSPIDYSLRWEPKRSSFSADLAMELFKPSDQLTLKAGKRNAAALLDTTLSGRLGLTLDSEGALAYKADLAGSVPQRNGFPGGRLAAVFDGDRGTVRFRSLRVDSPSLAAAFQGSLDLKTLRPEGEFDLERLNVRGEKLSARFSVESEGTGSALFAETAMFGSLKLDALDAKLRFDSKGLSVAATALRFSEADAAETAALGRLNLDGSYAFGDKELQATLSVENLPVGDLLRVALPLAGRGPDSESIAAKADPYSLTAEFFLSADNKDYSFSVPRLVIADRNDGNSFAVASVSGNRNGIGVRDIKVYWKGGTASGEASVDVSKGGDPAVKLRASYKDTTYELEGLLSGGKSLSVSGDYGLLANIALLDSGGVGGSLYAERLPVPVSGERLTLSVDCRFSVLSVDSWKASFRKLRLDRDADDAAKRKWIEASVEATQDGAELNDLRFSDSVGPLSGRASVSYSRGEGFRSLELRMAALSGGERYQATASKSQAGIEFQAYVSQASAKRFTEDRASLQATGEVRGVWKSPTEFDASFKMADLRFLAGADSVGISGSGRIDADAFEAEDARIEYRGDLFRISKLSLDRRSGTLAADVGCRANIIGRALVTQFSAKAKLARFDSWALLPDALEDIRVDLEVTGTRFGSLSVSPFSLSVRRAGPALDIAGGPDDSVRVSIGGGGVFYASLGAPSPLRGAIRGTVQGGRIDAAASGLDLDFEALMSMLVIPEVKFTGGRVTADLKISGPVSDPDFTGNAVAKGFKAKVPNWVAEEISADTAAVDFTGKEFRFGPVPVSSGSGKGGISGRFVFDRWIPNSFELDINVAPETPIPAKARVAGIIASGKASGHFNLDTRASPLKVSGRLNVESTTVVIDMKALAQNQAQGTQPAEAPRAQAGPGTPPPMALMAVAVDLELDMGKKVEFDWPTINLPILRGYAHPGDSLRVQVDGLSRKFSLQGSISLQGGEVYYFLRSFYVRRGNITFNENELRFDPRLTLTAEMRDQSSAGITTLTLYVDQAPLSVFMPRFEASPPLSQTEIFNMLGQNLVGGNDSTAGSAQTQSSLLTSSSDFLTQFNVVRVFERNARDALGLDMFSVRTQILQNAVFGATGVIPDPVDRKGGLGNYFDNTTVYMGKFLGPNVYLQGLLSARIDNSDATGKIGRVKLEPDIGVEWQAPFFSIRWNFAPTHFENLYINDQSFTLTWRRTY